MTTPSTTLRCQYRYDPLDRLVHQTQPDTPVHLRFYCKSRLATEIQGATKHSIIQHDDLLLAQQQREGDELDTTLLATDLQRSVLHTLKKGTQPRPIAYSPYGHRPASSGLLSLLGFNGERPDPVTGCYLLGNGYRAFNPVLMRFNSPDSWSPFERGGFNSYTYCGGDPLNRTDTTGHSWFNVFLKKVIQTMPYTADDHDIHHIINKLTTTATKKNINILETLPPELAHVAEERLIGFATLHESNKINRAHSKINHLLEAPEFVGKSERLEKLTAKVDKRIKILEYLKKHTDMTRSDDLTRISIENRALEHSNLKKRLYESRPPSYGSLFPNTQHPTSSIRDIRS